MNMRNKSVVVACAVSLATLFFGVPAAQAGTFQNAFGLSDLHSTITFDEHVLTIGAEVTDQYFDLGVTFSPLGYYSPVEIGVVPNIDAHHISDFIPTILGIGPITMAFTKPESEAAFAFLSGPNVTATFGAYLNGNLVDSLTTTIPSPSSNDFYGFRDITFDAIKVETSGFNNVFVIDNLQLGTASSVPEPSVLMLLSTGLAGLLGYGWRQRKKAA